MESCFFYCNTHLLSDTIKITRNNCNNSSSHQSNNDAIEKTKKKRKSFQNQFSLSKHLMVINQILNSVGSLFYGNTVSLCSIFGSTTPSQTLIITKIKRIQYYFYWTVYLLRSSGGVLFRMQANIYRFSVFIWHTKNKTDCQSNR